MPTLTGLAYAAWQAMRIRFCTRSGMVFIGIVCGALFALAGIALPTFDAFLSQSSPAWRVAAAPATAGSRNIGFETTTLAGVTDQPDLDPQGR